jgi:hypothetical protein
VSVLARWEARYKHVQPDDSCARRGTNDDRHRGAASRRERLHTAGHRLPQRFRTTGGTRSLKRSAFTGDFPDERPLSLYEGDEGTPGEPHEAARPSGNVGKHACTVPSQSKS